MFIFIIYISPLLCATVAGMPTSFRFLLTVDGIDPNNVDKTSGVSALWLAVMFNQYEIVSILVDEFCCKVSANELDLAKRNNNEEMLSLLNKFLTNEDDENND
ncbi:hypothetical protein TRFO_34239 [Tritrichomonas foetus]|uniref:Ankyrin repeat protein n=1 Tax=Tritrichomonas foetus TaxID=1144522 RepID=A0A1J4JJJ4_9EUKA|nr:hypothetical protein TRFO_34239 [Tritrichomonas foetus]|eukprot:OHS99334.1 hypothetical protein TRFO_34239 [Tritrichomonas foetus]